MLLSNCVNHHSDLNKAEIKASEERKIGSIHWEVLWESNVNHSDLKHLLCVRLSPRPQSSVTGEVCKVISGAWPPLTYVLHSCYDHRVLHIMISFILVLSLWGDLCGYEAREGWVSGWLTHLYLLPILHTFPSPKNLFPRISSFGHEEITRFKTFPHYIISLKFK